MDAEENLLRALQSHLGYVKSTREDGDTSDSG
jgi:hypothetical protein